MDNNLGQTIENRSQLVEFLRNENNFYSRFILEKIERSTIYLKGLRTESHHIIPVHRKGPNDKWNLILLTVEEHIDAHRFLFVCYGHWQDEAACCMMTGKIKEGQEIIRKANQERMTQIQNQFNKLMNELSKPVMDIVDPLLD